MLTKNKATLVGFIAIILWSSLTGTIRIVSENFGALGGAALTYSIAALFLLFTIKLSNPFKFPRLYLISASFLFVTYEMCFSLSIGLATNKLQAIQVSMINYLWPTFTVLATIIFNKQKTNFLIFPGVILAFIGIGWVLGGKQSLNFFLMYENIKSDPLCYIMAFSCAILWTIYCIVTIKFSKNKNGITLFFILTAVALWIEYFISDNQNMIFSVQSVFYLILAAGAMAFGYAAWNIGALYGNMTLLAGASYFTPVLSAIFSAFLLNTILDFSFWQGVLMVCCGAILCWLAVRNNKRSVKVSKIIK